MVLDTMPSFPPMVLPDTPSLSMIKSKNFLEVTQKKIDEQRDKAKENKWVEVNYLCVSVSYGHVAIPCVGLVS